MQDETARLPTQHNPQLTSDQPLRRERGVIEGHLPETTIQRPVERIFAFLQRRPTTKHSLNGFTLIELSIVLVIIALIVGAVAGGREMIIGAQIRQEISQLDKMNSAVMTFQGKYNALPGDIPNASAFGLGSISSAWPFSVSGNGNGDGTIREFWGSQLSANGENFNFWLHLANANLLPKMECTATLTDTSGNYCGATTTAIGYGRFTPKIKLPNEPSLTGGAATNYTDSVSKPLSGVGIIYVNTNSYTFSGPGTFMNSQHAYYYAASAESTGSGPLRPSIIRAIDGKIDDGFPLTGKVRSDRVHYSSYLTSDSSCQNQTTAPYTYLSSDSSNYCHMMVAAPF